MGQSFAPIFHKKRFEIKNIASIFSKLLLLIICLQVFKAYINCQKVFYSTQYIKLKKSY